MAALHNGVPIGPPVRIKLLAYVISIRRIIVFMYLAQLSSNIGLQGASSWLYVYPKGLQELLVYTKKNYQNPLIYITENGNYF